MNKDPNIQIAPSSICDRLFVVTPNWKSQSYHPHHEVGEDSDPQGGGHEGDHEPAVPARENAIGHSAVEQEAERPLDHPRHPRTAATCEEHSGHSGGHVVKTSRLCQPSIGFWIKKQNGQQMDERSFSHLVVDLPHLVCAQGWKSCDSPPPPLPPPLGPTPLQACLLTQWLLSQVSCCRSPECRSPSSSDCYWLIQLGTRG